jgi:demethylmenaquinone methyltransferase/2-methoxy-6-polyprenyl-1,4-benzoquinol methylase
MKMNAKDYFDNAASTWDDKFLTPSLASFLEMLVPQFGLESGQKVLDVGTGTGVLIPYLVKELGPEGSVTAIDFSENMVQQCKTKHQHLQNVTIKLGNIEETQFPKETFDAIICFGVFPHLQNKQKVLQNINSILKHEGKFVIAHALSSQELKHHHQKVSKQVAHDLLPKMGDMKNLLERNGFTEVSIIDEPGCYLCMARKF